MSTHSLTVSYAGASSLGDVYWVRIEQDVVDETATVSDAASLLDALYDIDACAGATTEETSTGETAATGEPTTDLATAVEETLDLSFCAADYDGSVEMDIRIYRSHLAEPYTLRLQGGELISTVQAEGQVTVTGEISSEMTLDYPVVSGFACTPSPIKRTGNTLRFAETQVGHMMTSTYQSRWDVVTIKVLGVDGEVGECRALAFHHGVVDDVELEVPDADELDKSLCPSVSWKPLTDRDEITCYKDIVVIQKCQCSEEELHRYTYQQTVPCPDREIKCPGVLKQCMHFLGTELVVERVACDSDNQIGGGSLYTYKVSDADYYRKICCQEPPGQLPACPVKRTTYTGNLPIQYGEAYWRDIYGQNARFVPVPPPGGICGEWIIKQQIASNNCCDGVPPLVWDASVSPEVMAPNSAVIIGVTGGGKYPYRWTVDGFGFQFQNGGKSIETPSNQIRLSALTVACGAAHITVTDGCSTVHAAIRCTSGRFVLVGDFSTIDFEAQLTAIGAYHGRVYGGWRTDGDKTRWSDDGRYWIGSSTTPAADIGVIDIPISYAMVQSIYGPWRLQGGCLDGWRVRDPLVGAFDVKMFIGCADFYFTAGRIENGTYSWNIDALSIWEWVC